MKALQERAKAYVLHKTESNSSAGQISNINAGYENLIKLKYDVEPIGDSLDTILSNVQKEYAGQIVISEGQFYYIYNKTEADKQKVKWCTEIYIKIWGYDSWGDFVENAPDEVYEHDGKYQKVKDVYLCTPDLTGFYQLSTRYVKWTDEGVQKIGTWTVKQPDSDWYDYKNKKWANVLVENNGKEAYFVWIPRYMYKLNVAGETVDAVFVDKDNNAIIVNPGGTETPKSYEELKAEGYIIPEAFAWGDDAENMTNNAQLAGYWISKYEVSAVSELLLDMDLVTAETTIRAENVRFPTTTKLNETQVATYTYYLNAKEKKVTTNKAEAVTIAGLKPGTQYTVNLTAKDTAGNVLASVTKTVVTSKVNSPDLTGFNPNTTFYVMWDADGNEYNNIPISQKPPEDWYSYVGKRWANIVTRNDGKESYFVWIPRYQYRLMNTDRPATEQYADIAFITTDKTEADYGYIIPETFVWNMTDETGGTVKQLAGYWISKYEVSAATIPLVDANIGIRDTSVKVSNIRLDSTDVITGDPRKNLETWAADAIKYEYYLNGVKKHEARNKDAYTYTGLTSDTKYTINIIARKVSDNSYLGAITKEIITVGANAPDLTGFDKDSTFYVTYDDAGNETSTISIRNPAPSGWYDYADKKWANIVTKNNGKTAYFVWIPRYAYKKMYGGLAISYQYADIAFIRGIGTEPPPSGGYVIPETFTWDMTDEAGGTVKQLTGYWISKYEVSL